LRELLRGNHRYVFTLIHKFQTPEMLCDRPDVIVMTDEAHRSQYDTLALNMRAALPKSRAEHTTCCCRAWCRGRWS
jgi:type I restriction enzyme R subunit